MEFYSDEEWARRLRLTRWYQGRYSSQDVQGRGRQVQQSGSVQVGVVRRSLHENPWIQLQEVVPAASQWPELMRRKFWCSNLAYKDRVLIAAFGFQNGIDPDLLVQCLYFVNSYFNADKEYRIRRLYEYWSGDSPDVVNRRSRYYAYDFVVGRVVDLNGQNRVPGDNAPFPVTRDNVQRVSTGYHC